MSGNADTGFDPGNSDNALLNLLLHKYRQFGFRALQPGQPVF